MKRLLLAVATACALAACGGPSHQTPSTAHCSPSDDAMPCALKTAPKPKQTFSLAPVVARGIDFGWSCPASTGYQFGASYLSWDASKNWTRSCVARWPHRVLVWEAGATDALGGYSAGVADARAANAQARTLGAPAGVHLDFAVDFDEAPSQATAVAAYFRGADSVLGVARVGAYGSYWTVTRLCALHLTSESWQTYAWSGGLWAPASCAPLEQYNNSNAVDYDRAIAADYGQWPYVAPHPAPQPKPKPKPKPPAPKPVAWTYAHAYTVGFVRGYDVRWLERRHLKVPAWNAHVPGAAWPVVSYGFGSGWKAETR